MFSMGESFYQENIIPFDLLSWGSKESDLFIRDVSPLPIISKENEFVPKIPELSEEIPLQEEVSNLIIEISEKNNNIGINEKSNHLGRKRKNASYNILEPKKKSHDKFRADNVFIKVKGHFQNFIPDFFNIILEALDFKEKFFKLNYVYIKTLNKNTFHSFKNKRIITILKQNISPKFRTKNKETNLNIIKTIKNNTIINNLLSESYINLFKNIYYKSQRYINLKKYGLNININLPKDKVQMYSDLIEKFEEQKDHKYIERINDYVKKKFLT